MSRSAAPMTALLRSTARAGLCKTHRGNLAATDGTTKRGKVAAAHRPLGPARLDESLRAWGYTEPATGDDFARQTAARAPS